MTSEAAAMGVATSSQYVGVGRRFVALLIDAIILGIVIAIPSSLIVSNNPQSQVPALLGIVVGFGYFIVMEGMRGQTIGKMAMGIRVANEDGSQISWGQAVVRNLLRIIDGLFAYLVGAIFIWTSDRKQRIGDRVGKTFVVRN